MSTDSNNFDSHSEKGAQPKQLAEALPGFDVDGALARLDGNIAMYKELLEELHKNLVTALDELGPSIQNGGIEKSQIRLHGLKGVCANLGATALNREFQKMERALATSREKDFEMLITHMEQTIHQNIAVIGALLGAEAPPLCNPQLPDAANKEILIETLKRLIHLLEQGRLDAAETFMRLELLLHDHPPLPEFENLANAIKCLDYTNARKALIAMAASLNIDLY